MRVSVVGCSGAGKTTFGRALADHLGVPFIELDGVFHQPAWTELPRDEFQARVAKLTAAEAWVVDGNYEQVRAIVVGRATDVVWIDPAKPVVMAQVIARSVSRALSGRELWNGNRENWREWVSPEHPIRWAWAQYDRKQTEYPTRFASADYAHLRTHRLRGRRRTRAFLAEVANSFGPGPAAR